jgi:hypothetical protein
VQQADLTRSPQEIVALLTTDLRLTTAYLHVHPKVYWIWSHRKWCLENVPLGTGGESSTGQILEGKGGREGWRNEFWKMELMLIEKMLDSDARNCTSCIITITIKHADGCVSGKGQTVTSVRSPRMGLQALCPSLPALILPPAPDAAG